MDREGGYVERIELNEKNNWVSIYSFLLYIICINYKSISRYSFFISVYY